MRVRSPWVAATLVALAALAGRASDACSDPIATLPPAGKGTLRVHAHDNGDEIPGLVFLAEVDLVGVLGADRLSTLPDVRGINGNDPELALARVGLTGQTASGALAFLARIDLSEGLRADLDALRDRPLATVDAFVDDAALWWRPRVWAQLIGGRAPTPLSRFRHVDRALLTPGVTPFLVDRVAPERRWGATLAGDLGALAYAAGVYADSDTLERRGLEGDPSVGGLLLVAAHLAWTPRAPIGADHLATPPSDPWFGTWRPAAGAGVAWRRRDDGTSRLDATLDGQMKHRRFAGVGELILSADGDALSLGLAAQGSVLLSDRVAVFGQGELDMEADTWSAGGGVTYFATTDRRNKLVVFGWVRREIDAGFPRDGVVIKLQASL